MSGGWELNIVPFTLRSVDISLATVPYSFCGLEEVSGIEMEIQELLVYKWSLWF